MDSFFQLLAAGGDVAMVAVAFAIWKLDRRLYRLELAAKVIP